MDTDGRLYFYQVPQEFIFLDDWQKAFLDRTIDGWSQINLGLVYTRKKWIINGGTILDSADFLAELLWGMKSECETLTIKTGEFYRKNEPFFQSVVCETIEQLRAELEFLTLEILPHCFLYQSFAGLEKAVFPDPGESMEIFMKPKHFTAVKNHVKHFAEETDYQTYQLDL